MSNSESWPEEKEKEILQKILEKLGSFSIDISKYDVLSMVKNDYSGDYTVMLRHQKSGRRFKVDRIFLEAGEVKFNYGME